ncbi:MAG: hypothetical protein J7599_04970 [Niabella sp.]|nr:hypothetical protein [Niabella sp.]
MSKDEFLAANAATQLEAISNAQFVWERNEKDIRITLYKLYDFYVQARISKEENTIHFDCFGVIKSKLKASSK